MYMEDWQRNVMVNLYNQSISGYHIYDKQENISTWNDVDNGEKNLVHHSVFFTFLLDSVAVAVGV